MSVYFDILTAVKDSLVSLEGVPPVAIRENAVVLDQEKLPLVLVVAAGLPVVVRRVMPKGVHWGYPVRVVHVYGQSRTLFGNTQANIDLWSQLRDQLGQVRLAGAESVYDTDIKPLDLASLPRTLTTDYLLTGYDLLYTSAEQRKN